MEDMAAEPRRGAGGYGAGSCPARRVPERARHADAADNRRRYASCHARHTAPALSNRDAGATSDCNANGDDHAAPHGNAATYCNTGATPDGNTDAESNSPTDC